MAVKSVNERATVTDVNDFMREASLTVWSAFPVGGVVLCTTAPYSDPSDLFPLSLV